MRTVLLRRLAGALAPLLLLGLRGGALALPSEVPADLVSQQASVERGISRLEAAVRELEDFAKTYPDIRDMDALKSRRDALRRRIDEEALAAAASIRRFDKSRDYLEARQGARWLSRITNVRRKNERAPLKKTGADVFASDPARKTRAEISSFYDLRELPRSWWARLGRARKALEAEEEVFAAQAEARAELELTRLSLLAFAAVALLAGALWLLAVRRRSSASPRAWALFFPLLSISLLSACASPARRGSAAGVRLVEDVRRQIGARYKFGGRSPEDGFDCSGLAWWAHSRQGIAVPATSFDQFSGGLKVGREALLSGDLVFFTTYREGPSHVGVYTGKGTFIHAPKEGGRVREERLDEPYWKRRYLGARRYISR